MSGDVEGSIPEPWLTAIETAGVVDQRTGVPSVNALALKAGLARATVWKVIRGEYRVAAPPGTLAKVAAALNVKPATVAKWSKQSWEEFRPFELPPEAALLPQDARDVVVAMVKLLALPYQQAAASDGVVVELVGEREKTGHPKVSRQSADEVKRG